MKPAHAHIRISMLERQAFAVEANNAGALLRAVRLDWHAAWDDFRAAGYSAAFMPFPDVDRLLAALDALNAAGHAALAGEARAIIAQVEAEKDRAAAERSNVARQSAKPGGAAGRINRPPASSFADRSQPPGDR